MHVLIIIYSLHPADLLQTVIVVSIIIILLKDGLVFVETNKSYEGIVLRRLKANLNGHIVHQCKLCLFIKVIVIFIILHLLLV